MSGDQAKMHVCRRVAVSTCAMLLLALLGFGARHAPAALGASLPGPSSFSTGFADDREFLLATDPTRSFWLQQAEALGSTSVRLGLSWSSTAPYTLPPGFRPADPSDPHYNWGFLDAAVREATADHQSLIISIAHAPRWAEGRNRPPTTGPGSVLPGAWMPSATAFGAFAHAVALRYSGKFPDPSNPGQKLPHVRYYQAWNEPNLPRYIMPQWNCTSSCAPQSLVPASPGIYRAMLNAFYKNVKSVRKDDVVMAAGTAPYGDPPGAPRDQMYPVTFYQELFCLTKTSKSCSSGRPHFDALDHHPYAATPSLHARVPGDVSVPDIGRISAILRAAQRVHHVLPAGRKPIWITELDWATVNGITPALQARFLPLGFFRLWQQGVSNVDWFLLRDPSGQQNSFAAGGLYYPNGTAKPAAAAYRFPFVAIGSGHKVTLWGKAPHAGTVIIEKSVHGQWRKVFKLKTTRGGIFYAVRKFRSTFLVLRARTGAVASPGFTTIGRL